MPITVTEPILKIVSDKPRRAVIAEAVGIDDAVLDAHFTAARDAENAAIRDANRGKPPAEQARELTFEEAAALIEQLPDSTVRGLINYVRGLTEPVDLAAWRRAWPDVFVAGTDEEASLIIRFADRMARDEAVMPEHFVVPARPNRGVVVRAAPASGAVMGARASDGGDATGGSPVGAGGR